MAEILLLDDQEEALTWTSAALASLGHVVRAFSAGSQALEELERWRPDLIVCDVFMPEIDGLTFAKLARRKDPIPVMFVSIAELRAEAVLAGAVGWVRKPATAAEVREAVEKALGATSGGTILVVDDDRDTRELYRAFLEPRFRVVEAENGKSALEALAALHVDLLIADIHMPVMNGVELVRTVRRERKHDELPIVVQSSDMASLRAPVWLDLCVDARIEKSRFLDWLDGRVTMHARRT